MENMFSPKRTVLYPLYPLDAPFFTRSKKMETWNRFRTFRKLTKLRQAALVTKIAFGSG